MRVQHEARAKFRRDNPQHVTLRMVEGLGSMRRGRPVHVIREAIRACHKPWFRVVHFAVLSNHVHLIVEAADAEHLARGVQGLAVRIARRANHALERRGALFADRYHARALRTPHEVRTCLRYVLLNQRHHVAERVLDRCWIDPCSSAAWFDGWARAIRVDAPWKRELVEMRPPVAAATVWLLTTGWRRHGPLAFDELGPQAGR
jgi:REP element-mobilizing transposase RayT